MGRQEDVPFRARHPATASGFATRATCEWPTSQWPRPCDNGGDSTDVADARLGANWPVLEDLPDPGALAAPLRRDWAAATGGDRSFVIVSLLPDVASARCRDHPSVACARHAAGRDQDHP